MAPAGDFEPVSRLVSDAIAAHRMPGAVVQIGHAGKVVFRQAFGWRKLADEPGLDGSPAPAEPMTEDTIFDLASLTKSVATTTAFLQLYEKGLVAIDEPVQTYLPAFNPTNDPRRAQVTLRMLLTHTSGIAGDLSLDGPWGLDQADKAEGVRRALAAWVVFDPGEAFHYSDINFILVGAIIEKITGEPLDTYVPANVFAPLGMSDTRYLPAAKACGPHQIIGTAITLGQNAPWVGECPAGTWSTDLLARIAPTAHDNDTPGINPDYDHLLRGTVHDPTARRMGGVAGSAGVFSTVDDIGRYAQALLDRLAGRPSPFPLTQSTSELMTTPQQPGHNAAQLEAANNATGSRRKDPQHNRSPARAGLSGDTGTRPPRLRLGHRYRPVQTARHDLSRRQLRPHRLHRNHAVGGPGVGHLRGCPRERDPSARRPTDRQAERRSGHRGSPGLTSLRQLVRRDVEDDGARARKGLRWAAWLPTLPVAHWTTRSLSVTVCAHHAVRRPDAPRVRRGCGPAHGIPAGGTWASAGCPRRPGRCPCLRRPPAARAAGYGYLHSRVSSE